MTFFFIATAIFLIIISLSILFRYITRSVQLIEFLVMIIGFVVAFYLIGQVIGG